MKVRALKITILTAIALVAIIVVRAFGITTAHTGDDVVVVKADGMTNALVGIDYAHHEIHKGSSFTAYYAVTTDANATAKSGLYIKTPAAGGDLCHAIVSFSASAAANFSICEAPTIAANIGTHTAVPYNRYRDSTETSGVISNATAPLAGKFTTLTEAQIQGDATWATGTVLRTGPLQIGVGPKPAGGKDRDTQEYILKANTKYVFLITNTASNANAHLIQVDWYEHTNEN